MSQPFGLCDADVHWVDSFNPLTLADEAYACDQELREQPFSALNAYILYRAYEAGVFKSDLLVTLDTRPDLVGLPTGNVRIQGDVHKHQIAFPDGMRFMPDYAIENIG